MRRTAIRLVLLLPVLFMLNGCGIIDYFYLPPPEDTAQELFEAGNDAMREKDYASATEYFTTLKDRYPFSPYTIEAELSLGDAYFLDEEYMLAVDTYKEFEMLHPRHEAIPYVLFQIGNANLKSFISIDRPQTNIAEAYQYFMRLQEAHPGTEYAAKALEYLHICRKYMAEHEIYVADFYWRTNRYTSAFMRYKTVVEQYADVEEYQEYARERARLSYLKSQEQLTESERERREGSWKDYFKWL